MSVLAFDPKLNSFKPRHLRKRFAKKGGSTAGTVKPCIVARRRNIAWVKQPASVVEGNGDYNKWTKSIDAARGIPRLSPEAAAFAYGKRQYEAGEPQGEYYLQAEYDAGYYAGVVEAAEKASKAAA